MRFIRRSLMAASYVLVFLGSAQAQSVTIGATTVWSAADGQNGNLLLAQIATLSQAATIQSLSFYVTAASGNLILGIYDATGPSGGPGALKATTASFAPKTGWNTAKVVTPVSLAAGSYWLAYLPSSNALSFVKTNATGNCKYYSYNFGSLPSKFSTSPASCNPTTWSFYATLTASSTSPPPSTAHAAPRTEPNLPARRPPTFAPPARHRLSAAAARGHGVAPAAVAGPRRPALRRSLRVACEWRVRQRERGSGKHRADSEPLHRRHGVDCQRQRPVGVELRRQQWRHHRVVLGYARLHRHDRHAPAPPAPTPPAACFRPITTPTRTGRTPACNPSAASPTGRRFARRSIRSAEDRTTSPTSRTRSTSVRQARSFSLERAHSPFIWPICRSRFRRGSCCAGRAAAPAPARRTARPRSPWRTALSPITERDSAARARLAEVACPNGGPPVILMAPGYPRLQLQLGSVRQCRLGRRHRLRSHPTGRRRRAGADDDPGQQHEQLLGRNVGSDRRGVRRRLGCRSTERGDRIRERVGRVLIGLARLAAPRRGESCGRSPKMAAAGILARLTPIKQVPSVAGIPIATGRPPSCTRSLRSAPVHARGPDAP